MTPFSRKDLQTLFDGKKVSSVLPYNDFGADRETMILIQSGNGRLSISGSQEKYALVEEDGFLRLTRPGESGRFIAKPVSTDRRFFFKEDMPANECLTMTIAREVFDMKVAAHGICWLGNGQPVYITRRFDYRPDGSKYSVEDFASVAGLSDASSGSHYKYSVLSYEECADLIKRYCSAPQVDLLVFFKLIVFNYLFSNADAHLKNFSLMETSLGEYHLAPAYDLLNTSLHISTPIFALEKGLFREGTPIVDTTPMGRPLLLAFGRRLGFADRMIHRLLDDMSAHTEAIREWIEKSLLSEEAKMAYLKQYHYRRTTLE